MSILVSKVFLGGFDCVLGVFRVSVAPLYLLWAIESFFRIETRFGMGMLVM